MHPYVSLSQTLATRVSDRTHEPLHPASCFARTLAELTCSSVTTGTVSYAQTAAGTSFVTGTCASGYAGSPQRNCSITGAWVDVGTATCTRTAVPCRARTMQDTQPRALTRAQTPEDALLFVQ